MDPLLAQPAAAAAALIRNREVSARELTELVLGRIDAVNAELNAVVELRREAALQPIGSRVPAGRSTTPTAALGLAQERLCGPAGTRPGVARQRTAQVRRPSAGQAYYQRKLAEGKSPKKALRCLKRRLSDAVYQCLVTDQTERPAAMATSN
jgi:hypothetical protein